MDRQTKVGDDMTEILITRHDILRILNGEELEINVTHDILRIRLMPSDVPKLPDGLEIRVIIVNEIVRCANGDDGMCMHAVYEGETRPCDVRKCPMFTENERNIREEEERREQLGGCIDECGRILHKI